MKHVRSIRIDNGISQERNKFYQLLEKQRGFSLRPIIGNFFKSTLIPGERFNKTVVRYLQFAREFNERFPGFETDVHGLVKEVKDGRIHYYVDCVRD